MIIVLQMIINSTALLNWLSRQPLRPRQPTVQLLPDFFLGGTEARTHI